MDALASEPVVPGETVGRFVVLKELGRGGMGVVLSAYDPELDRRVALKVLRAQRSSSREARERLVREAKAMAKLRHPNTVTVYEVGTHQEQVFLAMEYAAGGSLREWLDAPRSQAETIAAFVAAGRGLAAAHEAGMIHRDFKPENVLVGDKGLIQVTDFGLVGAASGTMNEVAGSTSASLTQTGSVLGTPAYMSPEQHRGDRLDARTDQFSFCVALWEALYGERPFVGGTLEELRASIFSETGPRQVASARVPTWIYYVLKRGLSRKREERFESMDALLTELERKEDDTEIGRRTRSILVALLGSVWTFAPMVMALTGRPLPTVKTELVATAGLSLMAIIGALWGRDSLSASAFNRRMIGLIALVFVIELVIIAGVALSDQPDSMLHQASFLGWFILAIVCVLFFERRLWLSALSYLAGFLVLCADHSYLWWAMVVCNGTLVSNCLWIWRPREGVLGRFKRRDTPHRGMIPASASTLSSRSSVGFTTVGQRELAATAAAIDDTVAAAAIDETQLAD